MILGYWKSSFKTLIICSETFSCQTPVAQDLPISRKWPLALCLQPLTKALPTQTDALVEFPNVWKERKTSGLKPKWSMHLADVSEFQKLYVLTDTF